MKIYISSTYQDLREHRAAVDRTLRRMGHDVVGMGARPGSGAKIARLRERLGADHLAGMFRGPEDLASQVAAAVSVQGINRFMVDRAIDQTSVSAADMGAFGQGTPLNASTIIS